MAEMDHRTVVAERKIGNPKGFQWYAWKCIGPDVLMEGCVCNSVYTKGPRKGRPKFDGKPVQIVVTDAEVATELARYESETGKCGECMGSGQVVQGVSVKSGTRYRPCSKCHATGQAVGAVDPHATNPGTPSPREKKE